MAEDQLEDDPDKHIRRLYQRLAARDMRDLLDDLLYRLKFTQPCENEGDMALNNFAKELVNQVYADDEGVVDSGRFFDIVRRLVRRKK
jgi:hypothetical protein